MKTAVPSKEVSFPDQFKTALTLIDSFKSIVVRTAEEFGVADEKIRTAREYRKELKAQYDAHPAVIEAKRIQGLKVDLDSKLEEFIKSVKNGPMLKYEQAEEAKRQAKERRLQAEAKRLADIETARLVAEQKAAWDAAQKSLRAAQKKGDDEAAAHAAVAAEAARMEAAQIKADAAAQPAAVVVVEKTAPAVSRRMVPKFRVIDPAKIPNEYKSIDMVKIGGVIRSLRAAANIPGVEYYEELA